MAKWAIRWIDICSDDIIRAFFLLPHEGWNDHFERLGEVFRKETGYLRPGKDESPQSGHTYEERQAAWDKWVDDHVAAARKLLEGK